MKKKIETISESDIDFSRLLALLRTGLIIATVVLNVSYQNILETRNIKRNLHFQTGRTQARPLFS